MATETWDQIETGWQAEKAHRWTSVVNALVMLFALGLASYSAYNLGAQHEKKTAAAADWTMNRYNLWTGYISMATAASENDNRAYQLLSLSTSQTTAVLERDLLDMGEWNDTAKRDVVRTARRCIPFSMQKFNSQTSDDRNTCNNILPPR